MIALAGFKDSLLKTVVRQRSPESSDRILNSFCFGLHSSSKTLDHSQNPCTSEEFVPDEKAKNFIFYIKMDHPTDWVTWKGLAKCLKIWDLDVRGFHKSMWRLWIKGNHVMIVGCPASPYCSHKPAEVTPIFIPKKEDEQS